jgi:hypothetical protein
MALKFINNLDLDAEGRIRCTGLLRLGFKRKLARFEKTMNSKKRMAEAEHLRILKEGVEVWNKWRKDTRFCHPDLSRAYLINSNLSGANSPLPINQVVVLL